MGDSPPLVHVNRVTIQGNGRTKNSFFRDELGDVLSKQNTLADLQTSLGQLSNRMLRMNMFDVVDVNIDVDTFSAGQYGAHIIIKVQEKGIIPPVKASSFVRAKDASLRKGLDIQVAAQNPFGYGEIFRASSTNADYGSNELSVSVPNITLDKGTLALSVKTEEKQKSYFTSFLQSGKSISASYTSRDQAHRLTARYALRGDHPLFDVPSLMEEHSEHTEKEASSYSYESIFGADSGTTPSRFSPLFSPVTIGKRPIVACSNPTSPTILGERRPEPVSRRMSSSRTSFPPSLSSSMPPLTPPTSPTRKINKDSKNTDENTEFNPPDPVHGQSLASSVLTSLSYLFTAIDSRDCVRSPSSGQLIQGSIEVAALPGQAHFIRSEVISQYHATLTPPMYGQSGVISSFCGSLGVVYPLQFFLPSLNAMHSVIRQQDGMKKVYRSYSLDRYQLGGPPSHVDFEPSGANTKLSGGVAPLSSSSSSYPSPSSSSSSPSFATSSVQSVPPLYTANNIFLQQLLAAADSLGGDAKSNLFYTLSVPLKSPVPALAPFMQQMRAFAFVNVGSLGNSDYWRVATFSASSNKTESPMLNSQQRRQSYEKELDGRKKKMVDMRSKRVPLFGYIRATMGAGLSVAVAESVRLEASCSVPVWRGTEIDDNSKQQLAFGLSLSIN